MTLQVDIMITKIETLIIEDLMVPNDVYNVKNTEHVMAIRFSIYEAIMNGNKNNYYILARYVYNFIIEKLPEFKVWLLVTHQVENNKISEYKGFWKSSIVKKLNLTKFVITDKYIVEKSNNKLSMTSVMEVKNNDFFHAINIAREYNTTCAMFLSSDKSFNSIENIQFLYRSFCKPVCCSLHPSDNLRYLKSQDILVRTSFQDTQQIHFIDFFMTSKLASLFV